MIEWSVVVVHSSRATTERRTGCPWIMMIMQHVDLNNSKSGLVLELVVVALLLVVVVLPWPGAAV